MEGLLWLLLLWVGGRADALLSVRLDGKRKNEEYRPRYKRPARTRSDQVGKSSIRMPATKETTRREGKAKLKCWR